MESVWSKSVIFGEKWGKLSQFGGKNDVLSQNFGKVVKKMFLKFPNIISVRFMDIYLVKNVINDVNLVKIGHFL